MTQHDYERLVQVYLDKDGYLIRAGEPRPLTVKEYRQLPAGFQSKQITISEFRATEWKWVYDKPKDKNV